MSDLKKEIIKALFDFSDSIRYVAIYRNGELALQQRNAALDGQSSGESDQYEELLVNPTLLKLSSQRGNIDCGGLDYLIVAYGNFHQLVRSIDGGHISICLEKGADLNRLPNAIFNFLEDQFPDSFQKSPKL